MLFKDLSFSVGAGECVELLGPNGSGKSTLLRALAGLYPDVEGEVSVAASMYVGHRNGLNVLLTPRENLQWYAGITGVGVTGIDAVLQRVGLYGFEDSACQRLSQGQQRRAGLAVLLLVDRPLWLLDEPLNALDTQGQALINDLLNEHCAANGAVFCATHQPLGEIATRSIVLGGG